MTKQTTIPGYNTKAKKNMSTFSDEMQNLLGKIRLSAAKKNSCFQGTVVPIIDISW